jgi:hypothetical protein
MVLAGEVAHFYRVRSLVATGYTDKVLGPYGAAAGFEAFRTQATCPLVFLALIAISAIP